MLYFERALCVRSLTRIVRTLSCIIRTRFARGFLPLLALLVPFRPLFVPLLALFVPLLALFLPLAPSAADRLHPCRIVGPVKGSLFVCLFVCVESPWLRISSVRRQTPRDEQEGGGFDDDEDGCVSHRKSVGA